MKRFAFAILLVAAVPATVFAILNRPGAEASPDVTITVNNTADSNIRNSVLTLREAMLLATEDLSVIVLEEGECLQVSAARWVDPGVCFHANPPGDDSSDTIVFDPESFLPASPQTITLGSGLPTLDTGNDTVDGSGAGVIVDGVGQEFDCFDISSDNNAIRGLEIYNCDEGVFIGAGAQNNTIGGSTEAARNIISGNNTGVMISAAETEGNTVKGNYIGTDASGDAALGNSIGVRIFAPSNIVGGSGPGEGNVISGNDGAGVVSEANGNVVKGNYIGTA